MKKDQAKKGSPGRSQGGAQDPSGKKVAALEAQLLRARADLENVTKRAQKERADLLRNGAENLIASLLPVLDNFQLATANLPAHLQKESWVQGIGQIENFFLGVLKNEGLEKICQTQVEFDPQKHEAVATCKGGKPNTVAEILQAGFVLNGKVLRPAKVKVVA